MSYIDIKPLVALMKWISKVTKDQAVIKDKILNKFHSVGDTFQRITDFVQFSLNSINREQCLCSTQAICNEFISTYFGITHILHCIVCDFE